MWLAEKLDWKGLTLKTLNLIKKHNCVFRVVLKNNSFPIRRSVIVPYDASTLCSLRYIR
jgi:hypothetical protein